MKYTEKDIRNGKYFLVTTNKTYLQIIRERFGNVPSEFDMVTSVSFQDGWMSDKNGKYFRSLKYTEVFAHELTFLNTIYEIY